MKFRELGQRKIMEFRDWTVMSGPRELSKNGIAQKTKTKTAVVAVDVDGDISDEPDFETSAEMHIRALNDQKAVAVTADGHDGPEIKERAPSAKERILEIRKKRAAKSDGAVSFKESLSAEQQMAQAEKDVAGLWRQARAQVRAESWYVHTAKTSEGLEEEQLEERAMSLRDQNLHHVADMVEGPVAGKRRHLHRSHEKTKHSTAILVKYLQDKGHHDIAKHIIKKRVKKMAVETEMAAHKKTLPQTLQEEEELPKSAPHEQKTLQETLVALDELRRRNNDAILQHDSDSIIAEVDRENTEKQSAPKDARRLRKQ